MNRSLLTILILAIFMSGCKKDNHEEAHVNAPIMVEELPEDFVVPQVVWDSMKPKSPEEKEKPILFTSVKLNFTEKNKNVLRKPQMIFEFQRGGGDLDLAQVVGSQPGTFFFNFELSEFEKALSKKVFFISQSRQRKVDGEILGSGCKKVMDISTESFKQISKDGIKINTTRHRHDSVLGGHMIFIAEGEKNWFLSQVTFFDSSRPELFCKGFRLAAEVR